MGCETTESAGEKQNLYAEFEVCSGNETCPVYRLERDVAEIRLLLTDGQCRVETIRGPETCDCPDEDNCLEVRTKRGEVTDSCYCMVFREYGCIPEVTGVDGGRVIVETYLADRSYLSDLVENLREVTEGITLRRLKRVGGEDSDGVSQTVMLDITDITDKQREAVMVAVSKGYYSQPREATLDELADTLDVTKAAVTQRLNAVEAKLAESAFPEAARP